MTTIKEFIENKKDCPWFHKPCIMEKCIQFRLSKGHDFIDVPDRIVASCYNAFCYAGSYELYLFSKIGNWIADETDKTKLKWIDYPENDKL